MARIYLERGELDLAISNEKKALEIDPKFYPAWGSLAEIYTKQGDKAKAAEAEQKFKEIYH